MPGHDIIVVGASAGGVEAITQLISNLPLDLPAAIFVVLHIPSQGPSVLPNILNRAIKKRQQNSTLRAVHPQDGEKIEHGRIYLAPPDRHLLIKNGYIHLARGPRENNCRPAVDPLFRTAARSYGRRVVGIVLSGVLDDGTAGLSAVKQQGGIAIAQDPDEALYSGMPQSVIENVDIDYILPVAKIAPVLTQLAHQPIEQQEEAISEDMQMEADMAELELEAMQSSDRPGNPSPFGCPDCGGVLWELDEGHLTRFRCRTGHAYSSGTLLAKQSDALEEALWNALRALEEKASLTERLARQARERNRNISARRFAAQAQDAQQQATLVRELLLKGEDNGVSRDNGQLVTTNGQLRRKTEDKGDKGELIADSSPYSVVAISASASGLDDISEVLSALPADFPTTVIVVQHSPQYPSAMVDILSRSTALHVKQAEDGDLLRPGTVYIAPANRHLLVNPDNTLSLSHSELVHFVRPSIDLMFESVAASFKQRAIAVLLRGTGSNGAIGVQAIKHMGGTIIAQQGNLKPFGPEAAINPAQVDSVVPLNQIAPLLVNLARLKDEELSES